MAILATPISGQTEFDLELSNFVFQCKDPGGKVLPEYAAIGGWRYEGPTPSEKCNSEIQSFISQCKERRLNEFVVDPENPDDPQLGLDCAFEGQRKNCIRHFVRQRAKCTTLARKEAKARKTQAVKKAAAVPPTTARQPSYDGPSPGSSAPCRSPDTKGFSADFNSFQFKCSSSAGTLVPQFGEVGPSSLNSIGNDPAAWNSRCTSEVTLLIAECKTRDLNKGVLDRSSSDEVHVLTDLPCGFDSQRKNCIKHFVLQRLKCVALPACEQTSDSKQTADAGDTTAAGEGATDIGEAADKGRQIADTGDATDAGEGTADIGETADGSRQTAATGDNTDAGEGTAATGRISEAERKRIQRDEEEAERQRAEQLREHRDALNDVIAEQEQETEQWFAGQREELQERDRGARQSDDTLRRKLDEIERDSEDWDSEHARALDERDDDSRDWDSERRRALGLPPRAAPPRLDRRDNGGLPSTRGLFGREGLDTRQGAERDDRWDEPPGPPSDGDGREMSDEEARRASIAWFDDLLDQCQRNWDGWQQFGSYVQMCEDAQRSRDMLAAGASPEEVSAIWKQ